MERFMKRGGGFHRAKIFMSLIPLQDPFLRAGACRAHLESTTFWRLESRQNPHAGKRVLRSAAFPGCGLAELSSSATGARLRRTLVVLSRRVGVVSPKCLYIRGDGFWAEADRE